MKSISCLSFLGLLCAVPGFAAVTVSSPAANSAVGTTFALNASATSCSSQPIASMGYSLDSSSNTTVVKGASLSASVNAAVGAHVIHVKSWGNKGASCVANVNVSVTNTAVTNLAVAAPGVGTSLVSPFTLNASGSLCKSEKIASLGYSLDNSSSTTILNAQAINAQVSAGTGTHTLHVKAWGNQGASCVSDVPLTILAPQAPEEPAAAPTPTGPSIPSTATVVKNIHKLTTWKAEHDLDTGSNSSATGDTSILAKPSMSGVARQFNTTYTNYGGERYHVSVGPDSVSTNFVFDTQIYIASPTDSIANIEMDLNQVTSNGQTVIMGFQCDGWSRTWDYTRNAGTPANSKAQWLHSNQSCNPQAWTPNAWHRVQIQFSRDNSGNVTYQSVWLDGVQQDLNVTVPSSFALGWAPTVLANFQVDGMTAGTS
ncbi:MAG TPA: hypothetical protein VGL22_05625, partial [Terracidiphilus sp.]